MVLSDSRVLISGSSKGIGLALAKAFAKKGSHLILIQRDVANSHKQELERLGAKSVTLMQCDLSSNEDVKSLASSIRRLDATESIDIFVNNAGILTGELIENQTDEEIINIFQVNLTAGVLLTKAVLPQMLKKKSGLIVSNCSVSSYMRFPCATTYAATKAGLLAFTECLEVELHGTGVRTLSLITPGVKTEMFDDIDKKYSKYFETPKSSISADEYAKKVIEAIEGNKTYLFPKGMENIGLLLSKYTPRLFNRVVVQKFRRNTEDS